MVQLDEGMETMGGMENNAMQKGNCNGIAT
jgi:hypothetical protein